MSTIAPNIKTFLKRKPVQSSDLPKDDVFSVDAGQHFTPLASLLPAGNQHFCVRLESGDWYGYEPHWDLSGAGNLELKLNVTYRSQRDNWDAYQGPGYRQCCLTSHVMAADYLMKGAIAKEAAQRGYREPEDLYGKVLSEYGDTTNINAHTPCLRRFGLESYFTYTGSIKDLVTVLGKGIPVPLGVAYKADGHYICAVGYSDRGVFVHDPFGVRLGLSDHYENLSGAYDFVTWDWLQLKWVDLGPEKGWMRVFTKAGDRALGTPVGL